MSDKDEKKFANLHYPGMQSDPNESKGGKISLSDDVAWRFAEQMECIGEDSIRALLKSSAFIVSTSPVGTRVAKKLISYGFGRVGAFGDRLMSGACDLPRPASTSGQPSPKTGILPHLSKWSKTEMPWVEFEPFREASIDRQLDDMVRGFDVLISCADPWAVGQTLSLSRMHGLPAIVGQVSGKRGWCAFIPAGAACERCIEAPANGPMAGLYYPLLDGVATWMATAALEAMLMPEARAACFESVDATSSPWVRERRELRPLESCKTCSLSR